MNKYVLSFFLLLAAASVWGQKKSRVILVSSTTLQKTTGPLGVTIPATVTTPGNVNTPLAPVNTNPAGNVNIIKVHNGVFRQDYSTLTSDSAYFYPDQNMVDAFGHVVINQGDTVHIYSDKLNYNGNTKIAVLTDHVIMVDKDATLTTDNFTYNTATRIGTYVNGGKLINKDNVLTSKNGYYFAFTRDAYFRYDVVCKTTDAVIKTDTMRYNSGTRINYFYGPTIIDGKDKDHLYTENGLYNTVLKQAAFGKNNLYTQGTKSLKGDSLFYDRLKGYGRAVKHVTFNDNEQRITLKGDLGEYFKSKELAVVTQNAYMTFVTEDSTSTKPVKLSSADSLKQANAAKLSKADSLLKKAPAIAGLKPGDKKSAVDSLTKHNKAVVDTIYKTVQKLSAGKPPVKPMTLQAIQDSVTKKLPAVKKQLPAGIKDSLAKQLPNAKKLIATAGKLPSAAKTAAFAPNQTKFPNKVIPTFESVYKYKDTITTKEKLRPNIHYDTLYLVGDTLKTQMLTYKDYKALKQHQYDLDHPDTTIKKLTPQEKAEREADKKPVKFIKAEPVPMLIDMAFPYYDYFKGWPRLSTLVRPIPQTQTVAAAIKKSTAKKVVTSKPKPKLTAKDSLALQQKADSIAAALKAKEPADTTRLRVIYVYNHAKIFKSDLQAKADSMFYSSIDSTIRMYNKPMIWTQASQLSGDTINLQMKNKKLDNLDMYPAAFIANIEKNDSTHFNQAGGKFMHGTFKNSKLNSFTIIGNAETIYFKRDSATNVVTDMSRTQSGRAYFNFVNGEITNNSFVEKYEARGIPIRKAKDEDKILKNFIWKPKDRPASKEAILSAYKNKPPVKTTGTNQGKTKTPAGKPAAKTGGIKTGKDTTAAAGSVKSKTDSLAGKTRNIKLGTDTVSKKPATLKPGQLTAPKPAAPKTKPDTALLHPVIKTSKDSVRKDTTALKKVG